MRRSPLALLIVVGPLLALVIGLLLTQRGGETPVVSIPASGPITIALAGDVLVTRPLGALERDAGFAALGDVIRRASFAVANLDMNLLDGEAALQAQARPPPRWPHGSDREAGALRSLGFDAVSLANDHAADYGPEGVASTIRILDAARVLHAGTGDDLQSARAPAFAESIGGARSASGASVSTRRVALIAVASSSSAEARATTARADIAGRPGLSPLRYAADITVDATTFQTLKESLAVLDAGPPATAHQLTMFGTPIRKGERTVVEFTVDESDEREILEVVKAARAAAEIVVVSLHSHEPVNASEQPAAFVPRFARAAIDAGATIVAGHGPHRLRGFELYEEGVIFYSLGNFLYQSAGLDFRAANLYDQGMDLYQTAVGGVGERPRPQDSPPDLPEWWEGLLAVVTIDQGRLELVRLYPLDLGVDKPLAERGIPRISQGARAERILSRLREVSDTSRDHLRVEQGIGVVRGRSPILSPP